MRTETTIYEPRVRQRQSTRRIALRRAVLLTAAFGLLLFLVGLAFAGSQTTVAAGTTVAGVDIGGLSENAAAEVLAARSAAVAETPVAFTAGGSRFSLSASQLGVRPDWQRGVAEASAAGSGFGPIRGFKRLHLRFFGSDQAPPIDVYRAAVDYKLDEIARAVNRRGLDAELVRAGLRVRVVEGRPGRQLDRTAAAALVARTLAGFERSGPVALPLVAAAPKVGGTDLQPAAAQARIALSAPVRLTYGRTQWRVPRWRIAQILALPSAGSKDIAVGGRGAETYLERLSATVSRKPEDARFQVTATGKIIVRPSAPGRQLDLAATAGAIEAAAFSPDQRTARLVVSVARPERSTAMAKTMGISGVVASYTTTYGGTPGRLNNVQLVARLIDGSLIKPGGTFSFNGTTGERTAAKGFQEAPVIINGELKNGLGGGICQVSTTVFNAAYEGGLPIAARTNHALYISHYPLGRDATVNYPDLDLRFTNDTDHWLLLRTFVGSGSLTVNLYGTPVNRRVESIEAPLVVTGPIPVKEVDDPLLGTGKRVVDEVGAPPRQTSVERRVYDADGNLLYDNTWRSVYVGEPTLVRVGSKEPPKKPAAKPTKPVKGGAPATAVPVETPGAPSAGVTGPARP